MKKSVEKVKKIVIKKENSNKNVEKIMLQNFVELQKVMTTLSVNVDQLSKRISNLLDLFENSARELANKGYETRESAGYNKILEGMQNLSEQNKVIARGLSAMSERREMVSTSTRSEPRTSEINETPVFVKPESRFQPLPKI